MIFKRGEAISSSTVCEFHEFVCIHVLHDCHCFGVLVPVCVCTDDFTENLSSVGKIPAMTKLIPITKINQFIGNVD